MDQGLAAIVAAAISTLAGGTIGFLSAYLSQRQAASSAVLMAQLPLRAEAAQVVFMTTFKALAGSVPTREEWDRYIMHCLWLPQEARRTCLAVLAGKEDTEKLRAAQVAVLKLCDTMQKGA